MFQKISQKFFHCIPTLFGITIVAFALIRLVPGDPVLALLGERGADPAAYQKMRQSMGLDRPLHSQYFSFITNAVRGDLGESTITKRDVLDEFLARFPATLELAFMGMFWAIVFGVPMGLLAAAKRNTKWDYTLMSSALIGYSMPIFWWGLLLILFFSVNLGVTPVSGRMSALYDIAPVTGFIFIDIFFSQEDTLQALGNAFMHILLPSFVVGTIPLAATARMTRSSVLEVLGEDYIRTAKAKGLSKSVVLIKHALRNALIPIITVLGLMFGTLITGAILTETIFSWPGIGTWMVNSVNGRDYPSVQGGILLIGAMIIVINLVVDFSYMVANPKLRK